MRVVFIPGFGEEVSIFSKIEKLIEGEKIFIDNWKLLENVSEKGLNVLVYAKYLVDLIKIKKEDIVIGHSMGGWIAWYIKHLTGSRIIQIASWTNGSKVITVPVERHVMYWLAKKGFGFNELAMKILVWLHYHNKASKNIFIAIFKRLQRGDKVIVAKQLMVIFNPIEEPNNVSVDLRIHGNKDHIVKPPDEDFYLVPGDHFSLFTFPNSVYKPINKFLNRI